MAAENSLPLPVARLKRRAFNAKSAKDRHDNAYFAFEVSVRLAVAYAPPTAPSGLAHATLGQWVAALRLPEKRLDDPGILRLFHLLTEVGTGRASGGQSVTARQLMDALPAYRNKAVGHGAVRDQAFYETSAAVLLAGIEAAWGAALFLPAGSRLLYVESITVYPDGRRIARVFDLGRETPIILDPTGTPVGDALRPERIYVRETEQWRSLHPWILFAHETEKVFSFNGLARRPDYLDYASGEILAGPSFDRQFPGVDSELRALFSGTGAVSGGPRGATPPRNDGDWIDDYRLLGKLGEGGMGSVYLAIQESLDRHVALKVLPFQAAHDSVAAARFGREIRALSRCEHPHVVKILSSGEDKGSRFYAMEYVEGADLGRIGKALSGSGDVDSAITIASKAVREEHREAFGSLPDVVPVDIPKSIAGSRYRDVARIFRDAARGVQHIHDQGVIHRDLKPSNIMVTVPSQRTVVMDLGLALEQAAPVSLTKDKGQILGTLRYMSPEQLVRDRLGIDRRADVYSLGASLYELLTDRPVLRRRLRGPPGPASPLGGATSDRGDRASRASGPRGHRAQGDRQGREAALRVRRLNSRRTSTPFSRVVRSRHAHLLCLRARARDPAQQGPRHRRRSGADRGRGSHFDIRHDPHAAAQSRRSKPRVRRSASATRSRPPCPPSTVSRTRSNSSTSSSSRISSGLPCPTVHRT